MMGSSNFVVSILPKVSSPFLTNCEVVGSKDTEKRLDGMVRSLKRLSTTVGILAFEGCRVPTVRVAGPRLQNIELR